MDDNTEKLAKNTFVEIDNTTNVDDSIEKTDLLTSLVNTFKSAMTTLSRQPVGPGPAPLAVASEKLVQTDVGKEVGKSVVSGTIKGTVDAANMAKDVSLFTGQVLNPIANKMLQEQFKKNYGINLDNANVTDLVMPIFGLTTKDFEDALKEIEPETTYGQIGSELTAFLVASSLMPSGGTTGATRSFVKGALGDAAITPRVGNLASLAEELGVQNEFVSFMNSYIENPNDVSTFERLKARVKGATTDSVLIGSAFLAATKIVASKIGQIGLTGAAVTASTTEEGEAFPAKTIIKTFLKPKVSSKLPTNNIQDEIPNMSEVQNVLAARSEQMKLPTDKRIQPSGENKLFDTSQQSYENLQVEQKEVEVPRNTTKNPMPIRNRTKPVIDMSDQIAEFLANKIKPQIGTNVQYFYHTGPLIDKAIELGISKDKAVESLKKFALNYAVTSPRTMTEQNLRNASLVSTKENLNIPMTELIGPGGEGINEKGYPMMLGPTGIHTKLINDKQVGQLDIDSNPKPITFAENVTGNLEGVTVDTHAIRAVFYAMNQIKPGSIPIDFIGGKTAKKTKEFQEMYKNDPNSIDFATMINDTLAKQVIDGKEKQTEYAVFSDIYKQVAKLAGVKPAEAQSLSWFANGEITGLASEPKTIVDLIDDRVDVTSQIIGQSKDQVFKKFFQGALPLLSVPAGITLLDTGATINDNGL